MSNTVDLPDLPWHALQRRLAEGFGDASVVYPDVRGRTQSRWQCTGTPGSWYERTRDGSMGTSPRD